MTRILVAAAHTLLATVIGFGGVVLLVQTELNMTWEMGFYGRLSLLTTALLITALMMLGLASVQGVSSFAFALGWRWGAWGLFAVSILLVLATPPPLSWIIALGAGALIVELWGTRPGAGGDASADE